MLARASLAALFGFLLLAKFSGAAQAEDYLRGKLWLVSNTGLNATLPVPKAAPEAYPADSGRSIGSRLIDFAWRSGVAADDVTVGLWIAMGCESEDRFERDVPMKAAVVAK